MCNNRGCIDRKTVLTVEGRRQKTGRTQHPTRETSILFVYVEHRRPPTLAVRSVVPGDMVVEVREGNKSCEEAKIVRKKEKYESCGDKEGASQEDLQTSQVPRGSGETSSLHYEICAEFVNL
jgi:hypothetical protein